jgi:hypothetical protein
VTRKPATAYGFGDDFCKHRMLVNSQRIGGPTLIFGSLFEILSLFFKKLFV